MGRIARRTEMTEKSGEALSDSAAYARLHITPLDADLVNVVLSSTLLPKARNISYHTIETFPEKRYGFLELPDEDAEKLKKKLNGAVLRGVKIRIERAKPSPIPTPLGDAAMAKDSKRVKDGDQASASKPKKRKREADLEGVVLEEGRKVKRGWTTTDDPKDKEKKIWKDKKERKEKGENGDKKDKKEKKRDKKRTKSKYTDHEECLVKTILPANAVTSIDADGASSRKSKKGRSREVIVHEFEKTTKFPTFLKATTTTNQSKAQLEYVDGKGWVDESGNVVEAVRTRQQAARAAASTCKEERPAESNSSESSSESSGSDESGDENEKEKESKDVIGTSAPDATDGGDAQSSDEPLAEGDESKSLAISSSPLKSDPARPKSSSSAKSLSIKIPPTTPKETKVHPLEALYKRPAQADGEATEGAGEAQTFSFFGNANDVGSDQEMEEAPDAHVPMTPYTRHDIETRGVRSAAPTPDTAHPSRLFTPWEQGEDDIQEDDEVDEDEEGDDAVGLEDETDRPAGPAAGEAPTSDFQKWFWENRGDINRSWRKRRKTARKEKRYRDNKARMARAI